MSLLHKAEADLPTRFGTFRIHVFTDDEGREHMALVKGAPVDGCLVRLHSECATGDILGSLRCDCREQLELAIERIAQDGCGMVVYLRGHEGRGIGLANKIKAYALQDQGMDTVEANVRLGFPADARSYAPAAAILKFFALSHVRLLTNNKLKIEGLEAEGIAVDERVEHWTHANSFNETYLETKIKRMGHLGK